MPRFAMIFPGQGSQAVGMLGALKDKYPVVGDTFAEAGEALGYDLGAVIAEGPAEKLDRTDVTQPALLAAGVAVWRVWRSRKGPEPAVMAGHSLGEYTALTCAEAIDFGDALRLVQLRGQAMQAAVGADEGAMAAIIGLGDEAVEALCRTASGDDELVTPANYNAPGQVVVAGHRPAVERVMREAKERGAKLVKQIAVSVPSHCPLMRSAAERLESHLTEIPLREPRIPVWHNIDAQPRAELDGIRKALISQLDNPVRWTDTVRAMAGEGVGIMLECGPGRILSGLVGRIDKSIEAIPLHDPDGIRRGLSAVAEDREGNGNTDAGT